MRRSPCFWLCELNSASSHLLLWCAHSSWPLRIFCLFVHFTVCSSKKTTYRMGKPGGLLIHILARTDCKASSFKLRYLTCVWAINDPQLSPGSQLYCPNSLKSDRVKTKFNRYPVDQRERGLGRVPLSSFIRLALSYCWQGIADVGVIFRVICSTDHYHYSTAKVTVLQAYACCTTGVWVLYAGGVLPIVDYTGWLRLKGVPFQVCRILRVGKIVILVYERVTKFAAK